MDPFDTRYRPIGSAALSAGRIVAVWVTAIVSVALSAACGRAPTAADTEPAPADSEPAPGSSWAPDSAMDPVGGPAGASVIGRWTTGGITCPQGFRELELFPDGQTIAIDEMTYPYFYVDAERINVQSPWGGYVLTLRLDGSTLLVEGQGGTCLLHAVGGPDGGPDNEPVGGVYGTWYATGDCTVRAFSGVLFEWSSGTTWTFHENGTTELLGRRYGFDLTFNDSKGNDEIRLHDNGLEHVFTVRISGQGLDTMELLAFEFTSPSDGTFRGRLHGDCHYRR